MVWQRIVDAARTLWGWAPRDPGDGWRLVSGRGVTGTAVNGHTALNYSSWWQGINLISGDTARVPFPTYRFLADDNRERDRTHDADRLMNLSANDHMDSYTFRETLQAHALSWGNGYAAIVRQGRRITQLIPLMPDRVKPMLVKLTGEDAKQLAVDGTTELVYEHTMDNGTREIYMAKDVFHLKGLSWGGLCGYSVFNLARESLGLGLTAETHSNAHFANGARPDVVIETPSRLDQADADRLLNEWEARHQNAHNRSRPGLVGPGMKVTPFPISNEDAQLLETRRFQRVEVASWLGIPPHKLGDDSRLSYNSIEAENRAYLNTALAKWFRKWKAEIELKLIARNNQFFAEANTAALLQGDFLTTMQALRSGVEATILNPNEARKVLNMNSRPGGDDYANPNTSTGDGPDDSDSGAAEPEPESGPDARMVGSLCRQLTKMERQRVKAAAKRKGFLDWCEEFYDATLPRLMREDLGEWEAIERHCTDSREILMALAGQHSEDTFPQAVADLVDGWDSRAVALCEEICGVHN